MELHMTNDKSRTVQVGGSTYGYRVDRITLDFKDMRNLLGMKDGELREYLGILYTRFAPSQEQQS